MGAASSSRRGRQSQRHSQRRRRVHGSQAVARTQNQSRRQASAGRLLARRQGGRRARAEGAHARPHRRLVERIDPEPETRRQDVAGERQAQGRRIRALAAGQPEGIACRARRPEAMERHRALAGREAKLRPQHAPAVDRRIVEAERPLVAHVEAIAVLTSWSRSIVSAKACSRSRTAGPARPPRAPTPRACPKRCRWRPGCAGTADRSRRRRSRPIPGLPAAAAAEQGGQDREDRGER